jgi:hypothetical protein
MLLCLLQFFEDITDFQTLCFNSFLLATHPIKTYTSADRVIRTIFVATNVNFNVFLNIQFIRVPAVYANLRDRICAFFK